MQQTKNEIWIAFFFLHKKSVKNFERHRNTNFCNSNIILDQQRVDSGEFRRVELNQFTAGGI